MPARTLLIERYRGLARRAARTHVVADPMLHREDLESAAIVGLIEAVDRFEPDRGVPFEAFARPRVRGAVIDEMRRYGEGGSHVRQRGVDSQDAEHASNPWRTPVSLDRLSQSRVGLAGTAALDPAMEHIELRDRVGLSLGAVSPRQREVLVHYYGAGLTLREAGVRMGITEARASQLRTRALEHMRASMLAAV